MLQNREAHAACGWTKTVIRRWPSNVVEMSGALPLLNQTE